jgi:hypothetical protein
LGGDLVNNAIVGSVSDNYGEIKTPSQAKKWCIELLQPIRNRILGAVKGNHENRSKKAVDYDITEDICSELEIEYANESMLLVYKIGNNGPGMFNYTNFITHGNGGGSTPGGRANAIYKTSKIVLADIYTMGHVHNMMNYPDTIFIPDIAHKKVLQIKRHYVISGSYMEWQGYAEEKMLPPALTGFPIISLSGKKKDFHVSI